MRSSNPPSTKENHMTTDNPTTATPETKSEETPVVVPLNRYQQFAVDHPRITKALLIGGVLGSIGGASLAVTNVRKNSHHVDAAKDHLALAAGEFTEAVSPTSENTTN
jgi:hypothetical protein